LTTSGHENNIADMDLDTVLHYCFIIVFPNKFCLNYYPSAFGTLGPPMR